jgi:2-dehydropantoate 2-reductase
VLQAAGVDVASEEEEQARRAGLVSMRPIGGERRRGGSTWQSLERGTGASEADQLNGEIVFLGRLYGVPTPVNELLQRVGNDLARSYATPGTLSVADLEAGLV